MEEVGITLTVENFNVVGVPIKMNMVQLGGLASPTNLILMVQILSSMRDTSLEEVNFLVKLLLCLHVHLFPCACKSLHRYISIP